MEFGSRAAVEVADGRRLLRALRLRVGVRLRLLHRRVARHLRRWVVDGAEGAVLRGRR